MDIKFNNLDDLFNYFISNTLDDSVVNINRNKIVKDIEPIYNADGHKVTSDLVSNCFYNIDQLIFQGTIQKKIDELGYKISFNANRKLTAAAGYFKRKDNNLMIIISSIILDNLFNDKVKRVDIGGIICTSTLLVFVIIMEHEMTHLILYLLKDHKFIQNTKQKHPKVFKVFIYNVFHQLRITHNLLFGDIDIFNKETELAKGKFDVGDQVECIKSSKLGILVLIDKIHGLIKINGKYTSCLLKDLKLIKKTEQQNILELIKNGIKVGDIIEIPFNNIKETVRVLDKSDKTFKVRVVNSDKVYSITYWSLI